MGSVENTVWRHNESGVLFYVLGYGHASTVVSQEFSGRCILVVYKSTINGVLMIDKEERFVENHTRVASYTPGMEA